MPANPNCPGCRGRGGWEDPDEGQFVTCNCEANMRTVIPRPESAKFEKPFFDGLERFVQLHQTIEIIYVVDGYLAYYCTHDGNVHERAARGDTILEALQKLEESLNLKPPKVGGPSTI